LDYIVCPIGINPLFRPGQLCKREGLGAFFKAKILRLRSPLYHERVEGGEQLLHNVRGLPQGWYSITIRPATESDCKNDDEVNN
jgi:hypothetical protein